MGRGDLWGMAASGWYLTSSFSKKDVAERHQNSNMPELGSRELRSNCSWRGEWTLPLTCASGRNKWVPPNEVHQRKLFFPEAIFWRWLWTDLGLQNGGQGEWNQERLVGIPQTQLPVTEPPIPLPYVNYGLVKANPSDQYPYLQTKLLWTIPGCWDFFLMPSQGAYLRVPAQQLMSHQLSPLMTKPTSKSGHGVGTYHLHFCRVPSLQGPLCRPTPRTSSCHNSSVSLSLSSSPWIIPSSFYLSSHILFSSHWKSARQKDMSLEADSLRIEGGWNQATHVSLEGAPQFPHSS